MSKWKNNYKFRHMRLCWREWYQTRRAKWFLKVKCRGKIKVVKNGQLYPGPQRVNLALCFLFRAVKGSTATPPASACSQAVCWVMARARCRWLQWWPTSANRRRMPRRSCSTTRWRRTSMSLATSCTSCALRLVDVHLGPITMPRFSWLWWIVSDKHSLMWH